MSDRRWGFEGKRWGVVSEFDGRTRWAEGFHAVCVAAELKEAKGGGLQRSSYRKDVSQSSSLRASVPKFIAA